MKQERIRARLVKGMRDLTPDWLHRRKQLTDILSQQYQLWGFSALETPLIEYTQCLGKFLPDHDRPTGGVFSWQDDDKQWRSLRYDMTAPLARYTAMYRQELTFPFKRYAIGNVLRDEKPGVGRFCEFHQCDTDIVGSDHAASDSEIISLLITALQALGFGQQDFCLRLSHRGLLAALLQQAGIQPGTESYGIALRAIDKLDRLGLDGVMALLGDGRLDKSGDFTQGAGLNEGQIKPIMTFLKGRAGDNNQTLNILQDLLQNSDSGQQAFDNLQDILQLLPEDIKSFIVIDPCIVRGLDYYTGVVFEADLTFSVTNQKGQIVQFGSVAGGGRYDNLIERFTGQTIPAVGMSIGIERLLTAMQSREPSDKHLPLSPVVITVMDEAHRSDYYQLARQLRNVGIACEIYPQKASMKAQMKYANRRQAPIAVIQGTQEREKGILILKDLPLGQEIAANINNNEEWRHTQPAQKEVKQDNFVTEIQSMLADITLRSTDIRNRS